MVNSAITPIVTYTLCTIKVPKGFIDNVDRKGGLNVINLRLQNDALLLKQLHKFYNKVDVPWVKLVWNKYYVGKVPHECREMGSFWWRDVMRLNTIYRGVARCTLGDGSTVSF